MAEGRFVAYFRVLKATRHKSGMGLEAQKAAVLAYLDRGGWSLQAEFLEAGPSNRHKRPELMRAIHLCQLANATLVIAKLGGLARNVALTTNLRDSEIEFVACDNPFATRATIRSLADAAERESHQISARQKAALAAARARGKELGGFRANAPHVHSALGTAAKVAKADEFAACLRPVFVELQSQKLNLREIAAALTDRGIKTPRGGQWTPSAVYQLRSRIYGIPTTPKRLVGRDSQLPPHG